MGTVSPVDEAVVPRGTKEEAGNRQAGGARWIGSSGTQRRACTGDWM